MGKFNINYRSKNSKHFSNKNTFKKKKKGKLSLQFDEDKRVEYLTGFRKRKNERRKRAQEEILENLKMEKKRVKQKKAEQLQKHLAECAEAVAAVENRFGAVESSIVELPGHTVTITEFDAQPPSFELNKGNGAQEEKSTDLKKKTKSNVVKSHQSKKKKHKQAKR